MLRRALAALVVLTGPFLGTAAAADEVRSGQTGTLGTIGIDQAWRVTKGDGVLVAVLDSGVDPGHRDLAGSVRVGRDFTKGANPADVAPQRLHGTYMASLIAGHGHGPGGRDGVIGVAPEARILSVRVILEDDEPGFKKFNMDERYEGVMARGIRYAVEEGADVINLSIAKGAATEADRAAVAYAISRNVVLVAAAGNDGAEDTGGHYSYPASLPGVISVAAVTGTMRRAFFSTRNASVMLAAPGVDILGAGPGDEYWVGRGTSQATALVSGVAALIKAEHPKMSPALVAQALSGSAVAPKGAGYNTATGFGVVNAGRALTAAARLAGYGPTASGKRAHDPDRPFSTASPQPIAMVKRDRRMIALYGGAGVAGLIGAGGAVAVIVVVARRARRREASPEIAT
ncbi:S8 family serine peptidase [Herbidospora cretacea]|uniref:S8 family serine peptidase n=1 Tax=Herbidospora cretacea TaxID=28444 RepID=UPI000772EAA6|nr:S8 family serine peptidase [Herbidospora cretacea]